MKIHPLALMLLTLALGLTTLAMLDGKQQLPVVDATMSHADYQQCIRVNPGPLKAPPVRLNGRGHVSEIA